jgi:hypothetical protein
MNTAAPVEEKMVETASHVDDLKGGNAHQVAERGQVATDM